MNRVVVLVDAGYFWVQVGHVLHGTKSQRDTIQIDYAALRQELLEQTAAQFPNSDLLRVCWYDGPGPNGTKSTSHFAIDELDDFKLRLGTRNSSGNQKAVDGLIIADLISLAQSKAVSSAILVSGDADLTPGVTAAQSLGIRVHLLSIGPTSATSPMLRSEVDFKANLADATVEKFASKAVAIAVACNTTEPTPATTSAPAAAEAPAQVTTTAAAERDVLGEAATTVFESVGGKDKVELTNGMLPKKIDAQLLKKASKLYGRELSEDEKRSLRKRFRALLG